MLLLGAAAAAVVCNRTLARGCSMAQQAATDVGNMQQQVFCADISVGQYSPNILMMQQLCGAGRAVTIL